MKGRALFTLSWSLTMMAATGFVSSARRTSQCTHAPITIVAPFRTTTRAKSRLKATPPLAFFQDAMVTMKAGFEQPIQALAAGSGDWKELLSSVFVMGGAAQSLPTMTLATQIQHIGETSLAALLVIAAVQGVNIMKQYSTNPLGELIVPPGLTIGVEDATKPSSTSCLLMDQKAVAPLTNQELTDLLCNANDTLISCEAKKGWYHVNRFLVLLLPFLAGQWGFAMLRFGHLFHIATILGLSKLYDVFKELPDLSMTTGDDVRPVFGDEPHVVVIGDSMSVGIGCSTKFDPDKNSGILSRIEQLELNKDDDPDEATGPVFPRALARTLSQRLGKPVSWRSGGVDGGDTQDIKKYLLPIIQEEVDSGKPPDIVVVLTGSNDLKHIISTDPEHCASVRGFRSNLMELVKQIQAISPNTQVVFPALPTYKLDQNSILNVFPLSFFLDGIIGVWDAQKIQAAKQSPSIHYVDLTVKEVNEWYKQLQRQDCNKQTTLIAADGIHPNAQCYAQWAKYVGNHLADTFVVEETATTQTSLKKSKNAKPAWGIPNI